MSKKILALAIGIVILAVAAFVVFRPNTVVAPKPHASTKVTVTGKIICLPHKNTSGPQTMECAFGIQDEDGINYGLATDSPITDLAQTGTVVTVTGKLQPTPESNYDIAGTIKVESSKQQ